MLLADFSRVLRSDRVLELCSGNGVVSMIIMAKYAPASVLAVELQGAAAALAEENVRLNSMESRIRVICADAKDCASFCDPAGFDAVVCNPPYFESGRGVGCGLDQKQLARHESSAGLKDFLGAAAYALKKGGCLYMIHRPERLADIIEFSREAGLEPKLLRMVAPRPCEAANLVLLKFVKGGGKELRILPQLYVRDPDGSFSKEIEDIYERQGRE